MVIRSVWRAFFAFDSRPSIHDTVTAGGFHELSPKRAPNPPSLCQGRTSMPYREPSRPIPDCLTPPKGATSVLMSPEFTPTIPYCRLCNRPVGTSAESKNPTRPRYGDIHKRMRVG